MENKTKIILIGSGLAIASAVTYWLITRKKSAPQSNTLAPPSLAPNAPAYMPAPNTPYKAPEPGDNFTLDDLQAAVWKNNNGRGIIVTGNLVDYNPKTRFVTERTGTDWKGKLVGANKIEWTNVRTGQTDTWVTKDLNGLSGFQLLR